MDRNINQDRRVLCQFWWWLDQVRINLANSIYRVKYYTVCMCIYVFVRVIL